MAFVQESSSLELFRKNVERILVPDHKITEKHREWLGYMLEYLINSVFTSCKPTKRKNYMDALMEFYKGETRDSFTRFIMMIALLKLPLAECGKANYATLMYFLEECAKDEPLQQSDCSSARDSVLSEIFPGELHDPGIVPGALRANGGSAGDQYPLSAS